MSQTTPAAAVPILARLPMSVNTSASPSPVVLGGELIVFFKGVEGDPGIYVSRSGGPPGGKAWSDARRLPLAVNTSAAPGAVVVNGVVYVFYKGAGDDPGIYVLCSTDGGHTWYMSKLPGSVNTSTGPSALVLGGQLYVLYKGVGTDPGIYVVPVPDLGWALLA